MDQLIKVVRATKEDVLKLQKIGKETFLQSFKDGNTATDMARYLEENFSVDQLLRELTNPCSLFYFATLDDELVGYLKVNYGQAQTDDVLQDALEIERIYAVPECHGKGVGKVLLHQALMIAEELGVESVWLGVWEENPKAIRFYQKHGFVKFDEHIFTVGEDPQTDSLMKLDLR